MCDVCFFFISLISRAVVDGEANTVADKVTNEINRVVVMGPYRVRAGELVDKMTIAIKEKQKGLHPKRKSVVGKPIFNLDFINNDKNAAIKWLNYPRLSEKTIAYKYDFCCFLFEFRC